MSLEPGIYKATVRGVPDVALVVDGLGVATSVEAVEGHHVHLLGHLTNARPLIVLDPIDATGGLYQHLAAHLHATGWDITADQIEAQIPKPARIPEPGQWAVVEATLGHPLGGTFVRSSEAGDLDWNDIDDGNRYGWTELVNPVLLSSGAL